MISMLVKISWAKHEGIRLEHRNKRVYAYNYVYMYVCKKGFLQPNRANLVCRGNYKRSISMTISRRVGIQAR